MLPYPVNILADSVSLFILLYNPVSLHCGYSFLLSVIKFKVSRKQLILFLGDYWMEYDSVIKNNEFMKCMVKWTELENVFLSEEIKSKEKTHGV